MSLGNTRVKESRKPKQTRLYGNRLRIEREFDILHEADTWAQKLRTYIFSGFGWIDGAQNALYPGDVREDKDFPECRLVAENTEEIFTSTGKRLHKLFQTYETLTTTWQKEDEDKPGATENGLRTLERVQVAVPGTEPNYDEDDIGVETITDTPLLPDAMVVEGAGTADMNTIYLRDGDEDGRPKYQIGDFVIRYSSIAIAPWEIRDLTRSAGFETLYHSLDDVATPDLVTTWLWANGDLPVPTVRRATWADIDAAGIDRSTVATISGTAKTLYLAGFNDDSDDRRGRFITRWAEKGILRVRTPLVGGQQQVVVTALGMSSAEVTAALSEVTANHKLIDQADSNYEGYPTRDFTYEVDDFDVWSESESGLKSMTRTQLSVTDFGELAVGSGPATFSVKTGEDFSLYVTGQQIDNGGTIKKRVATYAEADLIAIRPINNEGAFSLVQQYIYVSVGLSPEALHALSALPKPGGGTIEADAVFFEPEVQNVRGYPRYTQVVTNDGLTDGELKVHSKQAFFSVTDPGVMSVGTQTTNGTKSGSAVAYPRALSLPKSYERKGTVDVYLTTASTIPESLAAYHDETVEWATHEEYNLYFSNETGAASGSASWRPFARYLDDGTGDASASATLASTSGTTYNAQAYVVKKGDTTYTKTGIYRVIGPKEYYKGTDGTQYYLRTVITFA